MVRARALERLATFVSGILMEGGSSMPIYSSEQTDVGLVFNRKPRCSYLSYTKHDLLTSDRDAGAWLNVDLELDTFDAADYGNHQRKPNCAPWKLAGGALIGFLSGFQEIGDDGEQLAIFRGGSNVTDPWHGFPVLSVMNQKRVVDVLRPLKKSGVITQAQLNAILAGRYI
jgi:hypothetical protein